MGVDVSEATYVIAEIGVNHNGSPETAVKLIEAAAQAGADAVKIQVRTPELHANPTKMRESCAFPPGVMVSELDHRRALELDDDAIRMCAAEAEARGLDFFASCWDVPAVERFSTLVEPTHWKVASATLTDFATLDAISTAARETGAEIIASTGMSTWLEVDRAVMHLGTERLTLLHCCSAYPAENHEINLRVMEALHRRYGVPVGYSGHERGIQVSLAAVAMGAAVVERHITLDRAMRGSDHAASLEPHGFAQLVRDIRAIEAAMGDGIKVVSEREQEQARRLRK